MAGSIIDNMRSHRKLSLSASLYVIFISSECKRTPVWHQKAGIDGEPVLWDYHVVLVAKGISESLLSEIFSAKHCDTTFNQAKALTDCKPGQFRSEVESSQHTIMQIVFDLDTELPFPTDAKEYFIESFRPEIALPPSYEQRFRVVPAEDFMNYFSSDRSDNFQCSYYLGKSHPVKLDKKRIVITAYIFIGNYYTVRSHMKHSGAAFPTWPCIRGPEASSSMNLHEYIASKFDSGTTSNKRYFREMITICCYL